MYLKGRLPTSRATPLANSIRSLPFNVATIHCHTGGGWRGLPDDENRPVREMDDLVRGTPEDETGRAYRLCLPPDADYQTDIAR
jgi:hypothetical protein